MIGRAVPVSKKGYADLVHQLAGEVQNARRKSEDDRRKLGKRDGKTEELNLKVHLLVDD